MRNTKQNLERPSSRDTVFVFATLAVKGGAWNRQKELLRFLTVRGWTVHLIAVDNPDLQSLRTIEGAHIHAVGEFGRTGTFEFTLSVLRTLWQMDLTRYERIWFGSFAGNSGVGLALYKAFSSLPIQMFTFLRGSELDRLLAKSSRGNPYWEMKIRAHKSLSLIHI